MRFVNAEGREYKILNSKDNVIAKWTTNVQPVRIDVDGETIAVFGNPDRSNYIYFRYKGIARCVWAKDPREFDFLKETNLSTSVDDGKSFCRRQKSFPKIGSDGTQKTVTLCNDEFHDGRESASVENYQDLCRLFNQQINKDSEDLGIDSVYLPNPIFSPKSKYCLLAMEPSTMRKPVQVFRQMINEGFMNFIETEETLILQFCAFKYLCNSNFDFSITDILKGAMIPEDANIFRKILWPRWKPLLDAELNFFGNPRIIALGSSVKEFLIQNSFPFETTIWHYPSNNRGWNSYGNENELNLFNEKSRLELRDFMATILNRLDYRVSRRTKLIDTLFLKPLTNRQKKLLLYYSTQFIAISNDY